MNRNKGFPQLSFLKNARGKAEREKGRA